MAKTEAYPGYDVLRKRNSLSWNDATRRVIDARLSIADQPIFFDQDAWVTLNAVCDRIIPQPGTRPRVPIAAYIDQNLQNDVKPGFRNISLPPQERAWPLGLAALNAEANARHAQNFVQLLDAQQDALLKAVEAGDVTSQCWVEIDPKLFFSTHLMTDIISAYYAHPTAWSEIGYGGPASPRGYVRMHAGERDPWEAVEAGTGEAENARKKNLRVR